MREKAREHVETYKNFSSEHMADTPQPAPYVILKKKIILKVF
jgi:hypothetical protein